MSRRNEYSAELVNRLFSESIANKEPMLQPITTEEYDSETFDKFYNKLRWHIKRSLSKRQKQVMEYYLMGKTEREIAKILGVTQQVVNIYKHRAINKLHKINVF